MRTNLNYAKTDIYVHLPLFLRRFILEHIHFANQYQYGHEWTRYGTCEGAIIDHYRNYCRLDRIPAVISACDHTASERAKSPPKQSPSRRLGHDSDLGNPSSLSKFKALTNSRQIFTLALSIVLWVFAASSGINYYKVDVTAGNQAAAKA